VERQGGGWGKSGGERCVARAVHWCMPYHKMKKGDTPTRCGDFRWSWFDAGKDDGIRGELRAMEGALNSMIERALVGEFDDWEEDPELLLALVLLLDQVPRTLDFGKRRSLRGDAKALTLVERALAKGVDKEMIPVWRIFMYII